MTRADHFVQDVVDEYGRARRLHKPLNGPHEGYAVLLEEVDELWDEVRKRTPDRAQMLGECVQIAAMALAFAVEVCE